MTGVRTRTANSPTTVIRLCGPFALRFAGSSASTELPGPQGRLLFARLALEPARVIGREELIEAIWSYSPPDHARAALRTLLFRVRRALPAQMLIGREELRLVLPERCWIDVEQARDAAERVAAAAHAGEWESAYAEAQAVIDLTAGELLAGLDASWLRSQREELRDLRLQAIETRARAGLVLGGARALQARGLARGLVAAEPYRESAYVLLMQAQAAEGNVAHALMTYDRLRLRLREELGTAPGTQARELHQQLLRSHDSSATLPSLGLPAALELGERRPFVGRAQALALIEEQLAGGRPEEPRLVFIAGDPGVGKTRLVRRAAYAAHEQGAAVLYGACNEESLLPFEPFVAALRHYVLSCPTEVLRRQTADHAPELLVRVLPELSERLPEVRAAPAIESTTERHRLFEAIVGLLSMLGGGRPAVLALDDLHWADRSSLQLLAHLVRRAPVAILATYRPGEVADDHPLSTLVSRLRGEQRLRRLELSGLEEPEVAQLVEVWSGREPDAAFARALHRKTAGNPFFVGELLGQLTESARAGGRPAALGSESELSAIGVPEGVKEAIGRRMIGLSEQLRRMLSVAAVAGVEFHPAVVEPLAGLREQDFLEALDEGVRAHLLTEAPDGESFAFAHVLIRETLYESLSRTHRQRLHAQIAQTLERLDVLDPYARVTALAHHHLAAASAGDVEKAASFARSAGQLADAALAYEQAAHHYQRALDAMERGEPDLSVLWEVTMALGASCVKAGESDRGRDAFTAAAELARALGDTESLALAALGLGSGHGSGISVEWGVPDAHLVELLEEALAALAPQDSALRARVMARLAVALYFAGDRERKDALSAQAREMASRIGDIPTLAVTLSACRGALWGTDDLQRRLAATREIGRLADQVGDRELRLQGLFWGIIDFTERGDIAAVDDELERFVATAEETRQPVYLWYAELFGAMRRLLDWDLEGRRAHIRAAVEIGLRMGDPNVVQGAGVQLLYLRREQGRIAEIRETIRGFAEQYDAVPGWWGLLAFADAELERPAEARRAFGRLAGDGVASLPRDANWLPSMAYVAEACTLLDDAAAAETLYELLAPYADRNVIVGPAVICLGSLSRQLGLLAATAGRADQAHRHFQAALHANAAMGANAFLARTRYDYANTLLRAGSAAERTRALGLIEEALAAARDLNMPRLLQQTEALAARARSPSRRIP